MLTTPSTRCAVTRGARITLARGCQSKFARITGHDDDSVVADTALVERPNQPGELRFGRHIGKIHPQEEGARLQRFSATRARDR